MKTKLIASLILASLSFSANADDWSDGSIRYNVGDTSVFSSINALNEYPRIDFMFHQPEKCTRENTLKEQVWRFNGQNVRMSVLCISYDKHNYTYASAESKRGSDFIADSFKKSSYVSISTAFYGEHKQTAKGFTVAWSTLGSEAL
ncbi:hypothetical protein [Enterovibrio calviensis]|uniref:hypothetical protein n=1 Tax=Enterovibrio calviensis TaxID=91359 RepID=UPI000489D686|nr:hypothetical protein [Enterovibrio calviensis]